MSRVTVDRVRLKIMVSRLSLDYLVKVVNTLGFATDKQWCMSVIPLLNRINLYRMSEHKDQSPYFITLQGRYDLTNRRVMYWSIYIRCPNYRAYTLYDATDCDIDMLAPKLKKISRIVNKLYAQRRRVGAS